MKISYNWLREYLPDDAMKPGLADSPKKIGSILTSMGLELENLHKYEEITNNLEGLIIGEVISIEKHQDADKLQVASVNGQPFLIMSSQAYKSLTSEQITTIESYQPIIHSDITTIETNGGGSARCMMAEVFLQVK